jgi:Cu(I)/Ag(I) efflux system membrane protein CusA/SilA
MIGAVIRWSIGNRVLVLLLTLLVTGWGLYALRHTPVDAIPDLSDVQVIIKTRYPGQAPQVVEDQVTFPLTTAMLAVPSALSVRGYSFFGDSYVYVIFEDGTDLYWARSRVLEYLSQIASRLPEGARPELGPDATGVGWVYQYALVDRTGKRDLSDLRAIQDWFLKYELQTAPGVSEVATVGGMVRQYQVVLNPNRLRTYGIPISRVKEAIQQANLEVGGSVIERAEAEYMVRTTGYLATLDDLRNVPLGLGPQGTPILMKEVAEIGIGPEMRRGVAELDGEGEVVGGIVLMRSGENALETIQTVRRKLHDIARSGLPEGVEVVETYDRSDLILSAVNNLNRRLIEEFVLVCLVCALFLFHLRSSLVIVLSLPVGILAAFVVMDLQGINANIMSLGGIAIAIGTMVDAAIVMIENAHKHLEREPPDGRDRWQVIQQASLEVGPALFFSLLVVSLSFLPVLTLKAQEGRLFSPLAFTKTYAMAAAAILSITLVPVLMGLFIRGRIRREEANPLNRMLVAAYRPFIDVVLQRPGVVVVAGLLVVLTGLWPASRLGSEFMPPLDEGDLLYMPSTFPGISIGKAQELLQQTDKLIRTHPEVETVFGKIGRAETATDPAPLTMIETTIKLKPREEWRPGMTTERIARELDDLVRFPGLTNAWLMPIEARLDMLATGIKTPVGLKIAGDDLETIQSIGERVEAVVRGISGTASVYSERVAGGRYAVVEIDRVRAARFALNIADVQEIVRTAIGGVNVTETVEGRERFPVNIRYPREIRDSVDKLRALPIVTPGGEQIALGAVTTIKIVGGPPMIKSENARPNGWVFIDIEDRDLGSYVAEARRAVTEEVNLPPGYSLTWSGRYEYMQRARERLMLVVPLTVVVIVMLLYLSFRHLMEVVILLGTLPLALVGGFWLLYALDYKLSVAVGVGFIAMAGLAVEFGVVMLIYLDQSLARLRRERGIEDRPLTLDEVREAVVDGALLRLRPKMMTVSTIFVGLLPVMLGSGTGSEVMRRIAAPMVGGVVTSTALTLVVLPAVYLMWKMPRSRSALAQDS